LLLRGQALSFRFDQRQDLRRRLRQPETPPASSTGHLGQRSRHKKRGKTRDILACSGQFA